MKNIKYITFSTLIIISQSLLCMDGFTLTPVALNERITSVAFSPLLADGSLRAAVTSRNQLIGYSVNQQTGALTQSSTPVAVGPQAKTVAFYSTPNNLLFATVASCIGGRKIQRFSVDQKTAVFTQEGEPIEIEGQPVNLALSPTINNNRFLAATTFGDHGRVSIHSIAPDTGAFTQTDSQYPQRSASSIAFSPLLASRLFLAMTYLEQRNLLVYSVNPKTGTFSERLQELTLAFEPSSIAFSSVLNGGHLFAAITSDSDNSLSLYSVNQETGAFTQEGPPITTAVRNPTSAAFSPQINNDHVFIAIASDTDHEVAIYSFARTDDDIDVEQLFGDIKHAAKTK